MNTIEDLPEWEHYCHRGHPLADDSPNTYLWTNADGRTVRHCRTCRALRSGTVTSRDVAIQRTLKSYRPQGPVNRKK